ncbi:MAG: hypothetical protein ABII00_11535 [Elusimicrobiota bacterium]
MRATGHGLLALAGAAAVFLAASGPRAAAEQPAPAPSAAPGPSGDVEAGPLRLLVRTRGTVLAEDVFRIESPIEGRIENLEAAPNSWADGRMELCNVVSKEFAAMMATRGTTASDTLVQRWKRVYKPTPVRCPDGCFIMNVYALPTKWVDKETPLFEAARGLRLVGRVSADDAHWLREGQPLAYWDRKNPKRRIRGRVERLNMETEGGQSGRGGAFTLTLDEEHYLPPGTQWEGLLEADVHRSALLVRTHGTVRADEIFHIKSTIDGRIANVTAKPNAWAARRADMGLVLTKEFAAIMDARGTTPAETIIERWRRVYQPMAVRCQDACFVLKVFAREDKWVKAGALMVEAARKLRLVGHVRPGDTRWIEKGQLLTYWDKKEPGRRIEGGVERATPEARDEEDEPGGDYTVLLDEDGYLVPGTEWEGMLEFLVGNTTLALPAGDPVRQGGDLLLPVRVLTGLAGFDEAEEPPAWPDLPGDTTFVRLTRPEPGASGRREQARPPRKPPATPELRERGAGPSARPPNPREGRRRETASPDRPRKPPKRRQRETGPSRRPRRRYQKPSPIDVFPSDKEDRDDEPYPSDLD